MADRNTRFDSLKQIHDELLLQTHLMKMESLDLWDDLETKWDKLANDWRKAERAASESKEGISVAADLLFEEIEQGYHRLRDAIKH